MGIFLAGDILATSMNPEACCHFLVGSGWYLLVPGGSDVVVTRRKKVANAGGGGVRHFS